MFKQDPLSRSKLVCKLTKITINKSEEHIWKHINGKRFLNMLDKLESGKEIPSGKEKEKRKEKMKEDGSLKKEKKEKKKKKTKDENVNEVKDSADKNSYADYEDDFWIPPAGERWDHDDEGNRWSDGSDSAQVTDDDGIEDAVDEEAGHDAKELCNGTKRMSLETEPSSFAPETKKRKTKTCN